MEELRYPIGMQTFSKIIEQGYAYVDKTQYIKPLLSQGQYVFLSRPRRFGKSLLLSTLKSYFEGRRELFKGLAADRMDLDWTPSPVLHFDLNSENFSDPEGLDKLLRRLLGEYEERYGFTDVADTIAGRFSQLIRKVAESTGRKVVILVDEYDKPLLDILDNKVLLEKNQRILKSFLGNLKSSDEYIRFTCMTGKARFAGIFRDVNIFRNISVNDCYADICGFTEEEILTNFRLGIEHLAEARGESFETTLSSLRVYYGGYLFSDEGSRMYNPESVLNALSKRSIRLYGYDDPIPSSVVSVFRRNGLTPREINGVSASFRDLTTVRFGEKDIVPLMVQTGFLTIEGYDRDTELYSLIFPNRDTEVRFTQLVGANFDEKKGERGLKY